jgi:hypothetical protein
MTESEEKLKKEMSMVFDMTENPIMEYIADFLEEPPSVVFKEAVPTFINPLIMKPIEDYKKGIYLKFSLKSVIDNQTNPNIKELIKHESIRETIGFIYYAVKICYSSIVASSMINNKPMVNTSLVLDEDTWSFYPQYQHDDTIKQNFLQETLGNVTGMRTNLNNYSPDDQKTINKDYLSLMTQLGDLEITDDIKDEESAVNKTYTTKPRLVIVVDELQEKDLPKPKKIKQSPKLTHISNTKYADPT